MIHSMKLDKGPFESIASGTKTIEMRLYDEKRQRLREKDIIEFLNIENGEKVITQVVRLHIYPSFEDLYKLFDKISLGYKENETAIYTDMEKYYLKDNIKKYGVVGIEIKLV